jgi:hypothetical protein
MAVLYTIKYLPSMGDAFGDGLRGMQRKARPSGGYPWDAVILRRMTLHGGVSARE